MATTKKPAGPNPKEVVEKIAKTNGNTDVSKKGDMRDSGTKLPPVVKKGK